MKCTFLEYPKCSTCKKAKIWLEKNNIDYVDRNIVTDNPSIEEFNTWINKYKIEIKKLFNTSGLLYRELNLKDRLQNMTDEEKIKILSTNGMLVKRPILIMEDNILIGFKETEWEGVIWQ